MNSPYFGTTVIANFEFLVLFRIASFKFLTSTKMFSFVFFAAIVASNNKCLWDLILPKARVCGKDTTEDRETRKLWEHLNKVHLFCQGQEIWVWNKTFKADSFFPTKNHNQQKTRSTNLVTYSTKVCFICKVFLFRDFKIWK